MKYMNYKNRKIPRWKIETPFENWLSHRADHSEFWKRIYVLYYKVFDREFIDKEINNYLANAGGKVSAVVRDMIYCHHRFGIAYMEYFAFDFPHKNLEGREMYATDKKRFEYLEKLNKPENMEIFANKIKTYERFSKYYKRDFLSVTSPNDEAAFIQFVKKHKSFMLKKAYGSGGREVEKVSLEESNAHTFFESRMKEGAFVVEEIVQQVEELASFHPQSLNTLRLATLKTKKDTIIPFGFLRLGRGDAFIDNGASGGILCSVDPESGVVYVKGYTEDGNRFLFHPDTGKQIIGFKVPQYTEAVQLVKELAEVIPTNRYTGWDLALTENGWVMIEGNDSGQFLSQLCDGIGIREKLEKLIDE